MDNDICVDEGSDRLIANTDEAHCSIESEVGELALVRAVLLRALMDLIPVSLTDQADIRDAERWIFDDDGDGDYSISNVCDFLDLDLAVIRRFACRLIDERIRLHALTLPVRKRSIDHLQHVMTQTLRGQLLPDQQRMWA